MAVVLPSDDSSYFSSGAGSLRRSHSQPKFGDQSSSLHVSSSHISQSYTPIATSYPHSAPSSAPSSPRTTHAGSSDQSYASTPASNYSLADDDDETPVTEDSMEDHFDFSFKEDHIFIGTKASPDDHSEPPPSPRSGGDSYTSSVEYDSAICTPKPDTPEFPERAEDDTAATTRPTRQVDYLSHDWKEEDIWSSWKYIVSRRGEYANSERLENASWRTWMKAKNDLKTISPESLNWLKDCDVTWLYGPLQPGTSHLIPPQKECKGCSGGSSLHRTNSITHMDKKPILKKRSMSEVMLQRSLSTASLLKQAAAAVQAQEKSTRSILRPALGRSNTDYVTFPFSTRRMSHGNFSSIASTESSGVTSPSTERKHIHFNEHVEQCIAVECKMEGDDDVEANRPGVDSEDSDDGVMMKQSSTKKRSPLVRKRTNKAAVAAEGKTIAMLPSTTLKYRADTPDPQETAMKHSRSPMMSPSSSQETLRPSGHSSRFFIDEEDDVVDDFCDPNVDWRPTPDLSSGRLLQHSSSSSSLTDEPAGMRRTASGMFMPYEESEPSTSEGIFRRVVDTVNTARDIAHVIWNVGWRK